MHVSDMIDPTLLKQMVTEKYISARTSPLAPGLTIYNYTERAQFDALWNEATLQCRGLILDKDDNVVARPFAKFFNHGERGLFAPHNEKLVVSDKLDGSLGILFKSTDGTYRIATRGSLESEQAIHATALLQTKYKSFVPEEGKTYLFEILYPQNKIVVDYGPVDDLVLLAIISNESGQTIQDVTLTSFYVGKWPGPAVMTHSFDSMEAVLASAAEPVQNHEGFVVYFPMSNTRLKIKREEYKRLHAIVTGVSSYAIWEMLKAGQSFDEILTAVPDEFYSWVIKTKDEISAAYEAEVISITYQFGSLSVETNLPPAGPPREARDIRKKFALAAQAKGVPMSPMMALYDEKPIDQYIWDQVKPIYSRPYKEEKDFGAYFRENKG